MRVRLIIKKVEIPPILGHGDEITVTYHTVDVEIPDEASDLLKEKRYTQVSIIGAEILEEKVKGDNRVL